MSGFLSTWVGLLPNGVDLLSGERVLKNMPTPLFEQPLKFMAHGRIFESLQYGPISEVNVNLYLYLLHRPKGMLVLFYLF